MLAPAGGVAFIADNYFKNKSFKMKKIFFGIVASLLLSSALYAGDNKKQGKKRVAKKQVCAKTDCPRPTCDPASCVNMPGCICK